MARSASKIRSLNLRYQQIQGMMVGAMSGRQVEIRTGKPSLNSNKPCLPKLGQRPVKVVKKTDRPENLTRPSVISEAEKLRAELRDMVVVNNHQIGTRRAIRHPFMEGAGFERLSSKERGLVDHKRQRYFRKGALKLSRDLAMV